MPEKIIAHLKAVLATYKRETKLLVQHFDAVQAALEKQRHGHNDGWIKVQEIADKIEDEINLDTLRSIHGV
jgi:hypothetical protein